MNTLQLGIAGLTLVVSMYGNWALSFLDAPVTESRSSDGVTLLAQASPAKVSSAVERTGDAKSAAVESSEEGIDEAPLLEFVERHQPSLQKLLRYMRQKQPRQYQSALKELSRVRQRLTTLEKRDTESYQIELELWKTRSGLRMLVAEIQVAEEAAQEKLKSRLHDLVRKEVELESARLELEKTRHEERLAQVNEQLRERSADPDLTLSKATKVWENRAYKSKPKKQ